MTETLKDRATSFVKMFGSELALEFYHDDIANAIKEFCQQFTPESLTQLIKSSGAPDMSSSFYGYLCEYRQLLSEYDVERLAKVFFELITEVRPDLGNVLVSQGNNAATWLYRCTEIIRDKVVNPERYAEELEKALMVKVTCDNCNKSFKIFKEDAELMQCCPFCRHGGEEPAPG